MDRFEGLLNKLGYFSNFEAECYLERSKILISKREFLMASYFLNRILETKILSSEIIEEDFSSSNSNPIKTDLIKIQAKVKLAEISLDDERSMDYFEKVSLFFFKLIFRHLFLRIINKMLNFLQKITSNTLFLWKSDIVNCVCFRKRKLLH